MATSKYLLIGFIGFTLLQGGGVEPKGCSSDKKEIKTESSKSTYINDSFEEEKLPKMPFKNRTDVVNYLNTTFKNVNSEVTIEGRGVYAYVGKAMVGTIEVISFNSTRAVIKWGPYPFVVDLDCDCMINDAGGIYKPLN